MSETDILQGGAALETATDTKGRGPLPERCYACAAPVKGPYCYACGQKNDDCRRSIVSLFGEGVRDVVNLDGRFLRTVRAIFGRPGRYLRDYGRGVRSPYTPPVRFFLVATFAFFLSLGLTGRQIVVFQPEVALNDQGELDIREWAGGFFARAKDVRYSPAERAAMLEAVRTDNATAAVGEEVLRGLFEEEATALRAEAEADIADIRAAGGEDASSEISVRRAELEADLADLRADLADDLAAAREGMSDGADALDEGADALRGVPGAEAGARQMEEAAERMRRSAAEGTPDDFLAGVRDGMARAEAAGGEGGEAGRDGAGETVGVGWDDGAGLSINGRRVDQDRLTDALFRLAENPRLFNTALGDSIPKIMLLMVPLMALLGAMFVRGRDALLYDHAILSLNTHAVAFILMTLGLLTAGFLPGWIFATAVFVGVPFYYARAMRGAFGRSRRKVVAATLVVFFLYWSVLTSALTTAAVGAFADTL